MIIALGVTIVADLDLPLIHPASCSRVRSFHPAPSSRQIIWHCAILNKNTSVYLGVHTVALTCFST